MYGLASGIKGSYYSFNIGQAATEKCMNHRFPSNPKISNSPFIMARNLLLLLALLTLTGNIPPLPVPFKLADPSTPQLPNAVKITGMAEPPSAIPVDAPPTPTDGGASCLAAVTVANAGQARSVSANA